ncbi:MAG: hypothetical protein HYY50_02005 [Candidatus Kerfeldbacteria bacterium]|nr:hypothetical protein [Candidatus Kerfeldbacteria bacterium]
MWKYEVSSLAKAFFWFGLVNGVLAFWVQYGFVYQTGTQQLFGDPVFHLLLGSLSMLAGVFLNTERTNRLL